MQWAKDFFLCPFFYSTGLMVNKNPLYKKQTKKPVPLSKKNLLKKNWLSLFIKLSKNLKLFAVKVF